MMLKTQNQVWELITLGEAARRIGCCGNSLRRAIERDGTRPDAVAIGGSNKKKSLLFLEPRLKELSRLVEAQIH